MQRGQSYRNLLMEGEIKLREASIVEAKQDAFLLFEKVTGMDTAQFFLHAEEEAKPSEIEVFFSYIEKRKSRIPVSYLIGTRGFMGFLFFVNEYVLIPEQDTEILVEETLKYSDGKDILDLCTGSGCIGISLALLGKPKSVSLSDLSKDALAVAKKNFENLKPSSAIRFSFIESDLFQNIEEQFDIIVSNPPYIESEVIETLEPEVRIYEPRLALDGDKDGLSFYRRIIKEVPQYLRTGGKLLFEIGYSQAEAVSMLMIDSGFLDIRVLKDLSGFDRVVLGEWKK